MKKRKLMTARIILLALTLAGMIAIPPATPRAQSSDEPTTTRAAAQGGGFLDVLERIKLAQAQAPEAEAQPQDKPGKVEPSIKEGTGVGPQEQELKGLVAVGGCSGVLIANDWVLTAGHCIPASRIASAIRVTAAWGPSGQQVRTADAFYQFGGRTTGNPATFADPNYGPDLALIHLTQSFTVNGSSTGFRNQLYKGNVNGETVALYGRGANTLGGGGGGFYRAADLRASGASGFMFTMKVANGRVGNFGDSGGPGFIFQADLAHIIGIQSGCNFVRDAMGNVIRITSCSYVSVPATLDWIRAVLTTQWHPTVTSEPVYVRLPEIVGTGWGLRDVNQIGWAQATRAAAAMCYNRGFASGHFDGHQDVAKGGYGIQCSGRGTVFMDVSRQAIRNSGWDFADVNVVNWARANRAAERICATSGQGFSGGHFSGHMSAEKIGLFCYRDGSKWFDATDAEIAATGFGFSTPKLDDVLWAQAARAATGFCRNKGFSGGFMNGHQVPGRYGVVCQK